MRRTCNSSPRCATSTCARRRSCRACSKPNSSTAKNSDSSARSTNVHLAPIEASLDAGSIPVIASMGETADGQILNVNADFAANELVRALQPYKIVFLTETGGLLDGDGNDHRFDQPVERIRTSDGAAVAALGHAAEDRADQAIARYVAADVVGVDHASVGTGERTVHAQRFRHAGQARREGADVHVVEPDRSAASARADRIEFRPPAGRRLFHAAPNCTAPTFRKTIARRSS